MPCGNPGPAFLLQIASLSWDLAACFSTLSGGGAGLIPGALLGSYQGASLGIEKGQPLSRHHVPR
jgi:hypothetical protein